MSNTAILVPLTDEVIKARAPAVFAENPSGVLSDRYSFIPSVRAINALRDLGWNPVTATQSRCRSADGKAYTKHLLRFRQSFGEMHLGEEVPEIVVSNSHNGTSTFTLEAGLYRLACSNGLVISSAQFMAQRIRHIGFTEDLVANSVRLISTQLPLIADRVNQFKQVEVSPDNAMTFARNALEMRWGDKPPIGAGNLLADRREEDAKDTVWTVYNRVQENMIKGGIHYRTSNRTVSTRRVKSVNADLQINRRLWIAAEDLYKASTN